ncbi:MAG: SprB repeat-containing protein [Bacteroidetes bacterium]|nr:SprB repeat-containing protein [Bacteroidota bacterium]
MFSLRSPQEPADYPMVLPVFRASGGTQPYTYQWNPGGSTVSSLSGLAAGVYTCTATDAKGCSVISTMNVSNSGHLQHQLHL